MGSIWVPIVFFTVAFGIGCVLGSIVFFLGYMSGKKSSNTDEFINGYEACLKVYEERLRYVSGNAKYWQNKYMEVEALRMQDRLRDVKDE